MERAREELGTFLYLTPSLINTNIVSNEKKFSSNANVIIASDKLFINFGL